MSLDKATVARIATLARIRLAEAELEPLAAELQGIIDWIEQLNEVDTTNVAPMASVVEIGLPMRDDRVTDGGRRDAILGNAPNSEKGFFTVPKVVE
jgi:aspartyl-tRNA(Asn)/glutamyl-tRNA(Gln) amidotransferase subunit C